MHTRVFNYLGAEHDLTSKVVMIPILTEKTMDTAVYDSSLHQGHRAGGRQRKAKYAWTCGEVTFSSTFNTVVARPSYMPSAKIDELHGEQTAVVTAAASGRALS